jgi:hypothetical protein
MFKTFLSIWFLVVLACNAVANPLAHDDGDDDRRPGCDENKRCLSQEQGDKILSTWISIFVNPVPADLAAQYLTSDFHYFSESTNNLTPGRADTVSHSLSVTSVCQAIHQRTLLTHFDPHPSPPK